MNITQIKEQLHHFIEIADNEKLSALYIIMKDGLVKLEQNYSAEFKRELDNRYEGYVNGNDILIDAKESKSRIEAILESKL